MSAAWEFDIPIHKVGIDGMEIDQPVPQIHPAPQTTNNFKKPKGPAPMPYSEKSSRSQRREAAAIGICLKNIGLVHDEYRLFFQ